MTSTRDRALAAAVGVVGTQGVRALTHARVDAQAGLPKGSTSNWFRTRDALVAGVVVWIAEQERAELTTRTNAAATVDAFVDTFCQLIEDATVRHAARTRARYALFLEITAGAEENSLVRAQRSMFEEWIRGVMVDLGAKDPDAAARTLLAFGAGIIVNRLTVAPDAPLRPTVELAVRGCLAR